MIDLFAAAQGLEEFCGGQGWRTCFIGGLAVQRWGEPRLTVDIDLSLMAGFAGAEVYVDALMGAYAPRIQDARSFALKNRILLLQTREGIGIDVSLAALPFEERVIERASTFFAGPQISFRTCSAEDLIVMKIFAARPLDIRDAEGVAARQKKSIDWGVVQAEAQLLAEAGDDWAMLSAIDRLRAAE